MIHDTFDVAVVGGGPAGLAAALTVARGGARVVVCEPQGRVFDKPCGEGVLPRGVAVLERLGCAPPPSSRAPFRGLEYWIGGRKRLALGLDTDAWGIERPVLLAALQSALDAHGAQAWRARVTARRTEDGFELADRAGRRCGARVVIEAAGARGRASGDSVSTAPTPRSSRIGLRARAVARRPLDHVEIHFGPEGEVYLTPLAHGRVNVAVLLRSSESSTRGARALYDEVLASRPAVRGLLGPLVTEPEARVLHPHGFEAELRPGWLPCGDSAVAVDPILGAGVGAALESAEAAGLGALELLAGADPARVARTHARWVARATARARMVAGALVFLSEHARLASSVASALAHAPALSRACVRFALSGPRDRPAFSAR